MFENCVKNAMFNFVMAKLSFVGLKVFFLYFLANTDIFNAYKHNSQNVREVMH